MRTSRMTTVRLMDNRPVRRGGNPEGGGPETGGDVVNEPFPVENAVVVDDAVPRPTIAEDDGDPPEAVENRVVDDSDGGAEGEINPVLGIASVPEEEEACVESPVTVVNVGVAVVVKETVSVSVR